jgi:Mechanosensitive ion channel, conserved TM helix
MTDMWGDLVWGALADLKTRLAAALPSVLALLTLVIGGLMLAWLSGKLLARLAHATDFDSRAERWGLAGALRRAGVMRPPSAALERSVFWGIFALFAVLGVDALRIPGTWRITDLLFLWIPSLVGAVLLVLVGWLAANFLAQSVLIAAVNAGVREARALARAARWGMLLVAWAMAFTHLGIAKEMVLLAFGLTFGGLVLALALAFGLGGRVLAREILERRLRQERGEPHPRESLTHL